MTTPNNTPEASAVRGQRELEAFEAWAKERGNRLDKYGSALGIWTYESDETQAAYVAWQARAALAQRAATEDMEERGNPEEPASLEDRLSMAFTYLGAIRRRYGEPGSRDVDVTANNKAINLARKAIYDTLAKLRATATKGENVDAVPNDTPLETGEGDAR